MSINNRLDWQDINWATYLGCPVGCIPEYRRKLEGKFLITIAQHPETKKYRFEMYTYDYAPSGQKRIQLLKSGNNLFDSYTAALNDANFNIIPMLELNPAYVKLFGMPAKAIQMMLIKQRQKA